MAQVVDYEEFAAFREEVLKEREENRFYRELVSQLVSLNRRQAAQVIGVSDSTLHRLLKAKQLNYRVEGSRQFFAVNDLINYLKTKKIDARTAQSRLFQALSH